MKLSSRGKKGSLDGREQFHMKKMSRERGKPSQGALWVILEKYASVE